MKKRKLKKKFYWIFPIFLILMFILIIYMFIPNNYGYQKEVIDVLKKVDMYDELSKKRSYSKTLEEMVLGDVFDVSYFDSYFEITYSDYDNFTLNVNYLLKLGYTPKEINVFYDKVPDSVDVIVSNLYNKNVVDYINLEYFIESNLDRYIEYDNDTNKFDSVYDVSSIIDSYSYEDTVTFVNAYLDKDYYTNDILLGDDEAEKMDVIVNKYYKLSSSYVPSDLVKISSKFSSGNNQKLRKDAALAFEKMASAALLSDYKIFAGSTYRSYDYQLGLYNRYVLKDGFDEAETYSARAGYSEHQLGLAVDIINGRWQYLSEDDDEYDWLIDNSYKYGFILRYPRGKEYVTGYVFEDWHFRYLGVELATKVFNSGLTYEEYVARNL